MTGKIRMTVRRKKGMPCMSEAQAQAYLLARDALRRIQRASLLSTTPTRPGERPQTRLQRGSNASSAASRRVNIDGGRNVAGHRFTEQKRD
jgi:hypothetical protein